MSSETVTTVLLVEDSPITQLILSLTLETAGYRVVKCSDGQEALDYLKSGAPVNLILTDLQMPQIDGPTLVRLVRATSDYSQIPIILLTASEDDPSTLKEGVQVVLPKPCNSEELLAAVHQALTRAFPSTSSLRAS